jgi:hypothetical protein
MAEPIILENACLRMTLDPETGGVLGIRNVATGAEYLAPCEHPLPPFIIDVYSANQAVYIDDPREGQNGGFSTYDPAHDAPGDLRELRAPVDGVSVVVEAEGDRQWVTCFCALPGGIIATYIVALTGDSPLMDWRIQVHNLGAQKRADDLRVYRVAFPVLDGLCIGGQAAENRLARPFAQGELIPHPAAYDFTLPRREDFWSDASPLEKATHTNILTYPGWASMAWMDQYGPGGGLYLASCDPTFRQIDLESWPNPDAGTVTLDVRTYAFLEPGEVWESQRFTVGVHAGDWHWAADQYRAWATAHHRPYTGPRWVREECDGWFGTGGPVRYDTYPAMYQDAQWLGLNYLQIWSEMIEPPVPGTHRKSYYCYLLPDPARGGEAAMTAAVRAVRDAGGHIGFYYNIWTWDAEVEEVLQAYADDLPPDVPRPTWWGGMRKSASVFPNGKRLAYDYTHGYAGMCPVSRDYQDYVLAWLERYVKRIGVDTWYFDSMPVAMFGSARCCFSPEHGPGRPHGIGQGLLEIVRRVAEIAQPTVNLAITSETVSDALMQINSHALGLEMVRALYQYPKPEIYTYTFPSHAIFSGTCNGAGQGLVNYYPDMPEPRREDAINHVFLLGYRFDILVDTLDRAHPFYQYVRAVIALRQRIKADTYTGDFRDEIGLGPLPARLEARLFRNRAHTRLIATLFDRRAEKAPCTLTVDLPAHGFTTATSARLLTLDGGETALALTAGDGALAVELPAFDGEVAAVVVEVG